MTRARHPAAVGLLLAALASTGPAGAQPGVSGSNNVVVEGPMSGGTIYNGFGAEQVQALLKIVADLNQRAQRAAYTAGSLRRFVETLTRRQVPPGEWPQALNEITRRYLESETRLAAIPVTSEQIKALVARANTARLAGRFDEADAPCPLGLRLSASYRLTKKMCGLQPTVLATPIFFADLRTTVASVLLAYIQLEEKA